VLRLASSAMLANEPLEDGERGVCVNTASIAAYDGQIGQVAYSASKGGVVGMTLPAARDLASAGIRVCTIAPASSTRRCWRRCRPRRASRWASRSRSRRAWAAGRVRALAAHIVENRMLNGEVIRLDGALRMAPR
jgi:NAD(P)-dependent dehydrogenase (short-subunit alcohol dehydrogenase family)